MVGSLLHAMRNSQPELLLCKTYFKEEKNFLGFTKTALISTLITYLLG